MTTSETAPLLGTAGQVRAHRVKTGGRTAKSPSGAMPTRTLRIDDDRWDYAEAQGGQAGAGAYIRDLIDRDRKARII